MKINLRIIRSVSKAQTEIIIDIWDQTVYWSSSFGPGKCGLAPLQKRMTQEEKVGVNFFVVFIKNNNLFMMSNCLVYFWHSIPARNICRTEEIGNLGFSLAPKLLFAFISFCIKVSVLFFTGEMLLKLDTLWLRVSVLILGREHNWCKIIDCVQKLRKPSPLNEEQPIS